MMNEHFRPCDVFVDEGWTQRCSGSFIVSFHSEKDTRSPREIFIFLRPSAPEGWVSVVYS
jgi:hypothetical protein